MDDQVIGYLRVSTEEQADSRAGLEAQRAAILAEADRRGWRHIRIIEDAGWSGKDMKRPGIAEALEALRHHQASTLVVSKLDRLSRSLLDLAGLMARATREHWALISLDANVDTTTPAGEMMVNQLATFAQFERRLIGQRTRDALAVRRAAGVLLGRPRTMPPEIRRRILDARAAGKSFRAIAAELNADQVPTAHGGTAWHVSTIQRLVRNPGPD